MKVITVRQSRVKRDLTSILKKIESGFIDMVQVTKNNREVACIVRFGGDYQPPREPLFVAETNDK